MSFTGLSILLPVRNSAAHLPYLLHCLSRSVEFPLELLVQDGSSTDKSQAILSEWAETDRTQKMKFSLISKPDSGQSQALNRALERATLSHIVWTNADDLIDLRAVESWCPSADVTLFNHDMIDADGRLLESKNPRLPTVRSLLTRGMRIFSGSMIVRRESMLHLEGLDEGLDYVMDADLAIRSLILGQTWAKVSKTLGSFRRHSASKSGASPEKFLKEYHLLQSRYGPHVKLPTFALDIARQYQRLVSIRDKRRYGK